LVINRFKDITLSVTDSGCSSVVVFSDTVLVVTIPTGLNEFAFGNSSIDIVPNPNDGVFDIVFIGTISNNINVRLADVQGRIVYEGKLPVRKQQVTNRD